MVVQAPCILAYGVQHILAYGIFWYIICIWYMAYCGIFYAYGICHMAFIIYYNMPLPKYKYYTSYNTI